MQSGRGGYFIEMPRPLFSKILLCREAHGHVLRSGSGTSRVVADLPRPARKFLTKFTLGLVIPDPAQVLCPCNHVELALVQTGKS